MALFLVGITLFCVVHLFPALAPAARENLVFKLGENTYKGMYSLLILIGLVLIVLGWKATAPRPVYAPVLGPGIIIPGGIERQARRIASSGRHSVQLVVPAFP